MADPVFDGKRLVLGPTEELKNEAFSVDHESNRNDRMIRTLLQGDVSGVFLFSLKANGKDVSKEFIYPAGLSDEDARAFQKEFLELFEKYAMMVNK